MHVVLNELESCRFAVRFARLNIDMALIDTLPNVLGEADRSGIDVITTRVPTEALPVVHLLEDSGFRLMDTLLYYRCPLSSTKVEPDSIRLLDEADAKECANLARVAFHDYKGHYHADPRLSRAAADNAYADWAERLVGSPAEGQISLSAMVEGEIAGFLVGVPREVSSSELVLAAIDPRFQRRGLYGALTRRYLAEAFARGDRDAMASTQLQNKSVQATWKRAGFVLSGSCYTFHRWSAGTTA